MRGLGGWATAAVATACWITTVHRLRVCSGQLHQARHDPVTTLWTRDGWEHHATQGLNSANTVMLLDLDGFKLINDRYGHDVGDRVLRSVAQRLKRLTANLGDAAVAGRLGGDELVALATLDTPTGPHLDTILDDLTQPVELKHLGEIDIGVSIGAVQLDDLVTQPPQLSEALAAADQAMYSAKSLRQGWQLYSPQLLSTAHQISRAPVRRLRDYGPIGAKGAS